MTSVAKRRQEMGTSQLFWGIKMVMAKGGEWVKPAVLNIPCFWECGIECICSDRAASTMVDAVILVKIKKRRKDMTATTSVCVVFSKSGEKYKNNWSNKGNSPQHWIPKIRTEDKYFPRKVTTSSNCHSKDFSAIFNSCCWTVLPVSSYGPFWTIFIFPFLFQLNLQGCSSVRCVARCFLTLVFEEAIKSLPACLHIPWDFYSLLPE